jgi:16S rRNA (cytosine967-C5)-methyltransferase
MKDLLRRFRKIQQLGQHNTAIVEALCLGVVRFLNTIDFLIARCFSGMPLNQLPSRERNALRLAVLEVVWKDRDHEEILRSYLSPYAPAQKALGCIDKTRLGELTHELPLCERLSVEYAHPSFLVEVLLDQLGEASAISLMKANNKPPVTYVRNNRLLDSGQEGIQTLCEDGISLQEDHDMPGVYRLLDAVDRVIKSKAYRSGHVLLQDKSSVFAVHALSPQAGRTIWDACAAPGMKTQLVWEEMNAEGRLVATDISFSRLKGTVQRLGKLGCQMVEFMRADATMPVVSKAEKILIDAPCTSTGILSSNPSFKWRLNKKTLFDLMTIQNKILDAILTVYADRAGTEIVYSTCSLLPHEGESQVDSALTRHSIELVDLPEIGEKGYSGFRCSPSVRRFFPHLHGTNGFFVAKMRISP